MMSASQRTGAPGAWTNILAVALLVLGSGLAGCGDREDEDSVAVTASPPQSPTGYVEPVDTVAALWEALSADRWDEAARLTVEGQMALVALAEGADIETVSDYLQLGEVAVGVNFWAGFTQAAEEFLAGSVGDLRIVSQRLYQAGGVSFVDFQLSSSTSPEGRTFKLTVARSEDLLWRVDVIATFVDALAYRLSETAEITRATRSEDAAIVSAELARHIPSLEAVLTDPDLTVESSQGVLSALAVIR